MTWTLRHLLQKKAWNDFFDAVSQTLWQGTGQLQQLQSNDRIRERFRSQAEKSYQYLRISTTTYAAYSAIAHRGRAYDHCSEWTDSTHWVYLG